MTWLAALSLAVWIYLLCGRAGFWRLRVDRPAAPASGASVAVVVPARDEAALAGDAIASLLRQDYDGPVHIFLVDDHSTDATAAAAREAARLAGGAARFTVIAAPSLPPGWSGKLWAVAAGLEQAYRLEPEFILLTDADVVHAPGNLAELVGRAASGGYDLVSLMVRLHCRSWAERALIPAFVFFFLKLYPPAWIRRRECRTAGAAGGCMLVRASALRRIGGIAAVHSAVIDDCALAAAVKRTGGGLWLGLADATVSTRPYGGAGEIRRMISRTAFAQLEHSPVLLVLTLAGLFLTYLVPPLAVVAGPPAARGLGIAAWAVMSLAYLPAVRFYKLSPLRAPLLPLIALFYAAATVESAVLYWRGAGGAWKGRTQDRKPSPKT